MRLPVSKRPLVFCVVPIITLALCGPIDRLSSLVPARENTVNNLSPLVPIQEDPIRQILTDPFEKRSETPASTRELVEVCPCDCNKCIDHRGPNALWLERENKELRFWGRFIMVTYAFIVVYVIALVFYFLQRLRNAGHIMEIWTQWRRARVARRTAVE